MLKSLLNQAVPKLYGFYFNATSLFSKKKAAHLAMATFSLPRKGKIAPFQEEFLNTARQQKIVVEEGFIQLYHWQGSGKTVFLAHGWESNAWRWKYLIEPLITLDYNIIAIDAPAHGASSGTYFTAVKYSKIINKVIELYQPQIVIAHSVAAMATTYQESLSPHPFLQKLILLGGPDRLELIMRNYQKLTGFNHAVYNQLNQLLFDKYGFNVEDFNTSTFARSIKCETLIIHSKEDKIVTADSLPSIAANLDKVETYYSKTGGHSLHTQEVVDKILEFL